MDIVVKRSFESSKTFIVGFGFLGISIIWPIINQFIPIFLQAGNPEFERQLLGLYYFSSQLAAVLDPSLDGIIMDLSGEQFRWVSIFSTLFMGWPG